ncbi:MAG: hypothetical protein WC322_03855 [Candidatus Paceibacterota bacterium]|jgi:predicted methyltransferase MtxX (methanogen marker protein 4)
MDGQQSLIERLRNCKSCAERRAAMREAAVKLRDALGLKSTIRARQMLLRQMNEQGKTRENP